MFRNILCFSALCLVWSSAFLAIPNLPAVATTQACDGSTCRIEQGSVRCSIRVDAHMKAEGPRRVAVVTCLTPDCGSSRLSALWTAAKSVGSALWDTLAVGFRTGACLVRTAAGVVAEVAAS